MAKIYRWNGSSSSLGYVGNWAVSTDGGTTFVPASSLPTSADQVEIEGTTILSGALTAAFVGLVGNGTVTVSHPSTWTALDAVVIGDDADVDYEILDVNAALTVSASEFFIGSAAMGQVSIGAGGSLTTNGGIYVGDLASTTLAV